MKHILRFTAAFILIMLIGANIGWGQILTFEFSALAGDEATASSNFNNSNLTSSTISRGSGLTASANSQRFNATSWALTSIANAVSGNDYMQFTITPNSGYQFSISSIVVQWQRSATGNTAIALRSSVDSYASDLDAVKSVTDNTSTQTFTWTFTQANSTSAITYRFYSYAEATTGSGGPGDGTGNDIVVNGEVTSAGNTPPTLTTQAVTSIGTTTAAGNGNITATGGVNPTKRGFCWDLATNPDPDTDDSKVEETGDFTPGTFTGDITGLTAGTQYKVRAYAINSEGTGYGGVVTFTTLSNEPTNHPENFTATANSTSAITVSWTDSDAEGYLIKGSNVNYGSIVYPTDGVAEGDGGLVKNVASGQGSHQFTGLNPGTDYFFKIFAYNGTGTTINYKTTETVPFATAKTNTTALIGVDPATLTGFTYVQSSGPSTAQTFQLSGTNLTPASGDLTVTGSANYEVSVNGTDYYASRTVAYTGGALSATTIHVRLKAGLTAGNYNSENVACSGGGAEAKNVTCSGTVYKDAPGNHVTGFLAGTGTPSYSVIDVVWDDAVGGTLPDAYLIKGSSVSYEAIVAPVNGTPESDGALVKNVNYAVENASFTGQTENTTYYFKIFPYSNSGSQIIYKTDGMVPETTETTEVRPIPTYTWNVASGNWATAGSWTPARTTPANDDVLIFDGTLQATPTITTDFTTPQTVGMLRIINNAVVTIATNGAARTLNIGYTGAASPQLEIAAGSSLTVTAATNALTLNVPTGFTGSISGHITLSTTGHRLTAVDAAGITFNSGSKFTAGTGFSGNPFGTANLNSIVFASGSIFEYTAGSNPFGATQPSSVVVFQAGSLYKHMSTNSPAFQGRIYADFEYDFNGASSVSGGTAAVLLDNFTVTQGTFNFNMTGTVGHTIKGNITVSPGATFTFSPTSALTLILGGTSQQTISGAGTLTIGSNCSVAIGSSAQVVVNKDLTFGKDLTISSGGTFTVNPTKFVTVTGTLTNNATAAGLVIKSDATGTGSLICNQSVNATVERYLTQNYYHYISSPVDGQLISPEFINTGGTVASQSAIDLFKFDEITNTWDNIKNGSTWDGSFETTFTTAKGYIYSNTTGNVTKNFAGALNVANKTIPLTFTPAKGNGWNIVGNPFASAIAANSGAQATNNLMDVNFDLYNVESTALYFWDEQDNYSGEARVSEYKTINNTSGAYFINPGQAFFVKAKEPGDYVFNANMRKHGTSPFYKSTDEGDINRFNLAITGPLGDYNETLIGFVTGTTTGLDQGYDAIKRKGNSNIALYSKLVDGSPGDFAIQALPQSSASEVVAISLDANKTGNYVFKAGAMDNMENITVKLEDRLNGTFTTLEGSAQYSFAVLTTGKIENRFYLHFKSSVGINDPEAARQAIYSNGSNIFIETTGNAVIEIYNLTGQLITSRTVSGIGLQSFSINAPKGWYIARMVMPGSVLSQKIFIN